MSQTHAERSPRHPDAHAEPTVATPPSSDSVPAPDQGGHAHSHAAHLDEAGASHTRPAGNLRQGSAPSALREPPMEVSRAGKQHRRQ